MPAPSSALNTPRDNSVTVQNKKQAHRKSVRDDYDEVRGTSSSAASKAPLLNSLFWDEGMDVTRLRSLAGPPPQTMAQEPDADGGEEEENGSCKCFFY